eukprot:m.87090 g.87090  ORF g.87090 m.87090 type:complete len:106 (+) comp8781_c0_seq2:984-1301(+)
MSSLKSSLLSSIFRTPLSPFLQEPLPHLVIDLRVEVVKPNRRFHRPEDVLFIVLTESLGVFCLHTNQRIHCTLWNRFASPLQRRLFGVMAVEFENQHSHRHSSNT